MRVSDTKLHSAIEALRCFGTLSYPVFNYAIESRGVENITTPTSDHYKFRGKDGECVFKTGDDPLISWHTRPYMFNALLFRNAMLGVLNKCGLESE